MDEVVKLRLDVQSQSAKQASEDVQSLNKEVYELADATGTADRALDTYELTTIEVMQKIRQQVEAIRDEIKAYQLLETAEKAVVVTTKEMAAATQQAAVVTKESTLNISRIGMGINQLVQGLEDAQYSIGGAMNNIGAAFMMFNASGFVVAGVTAAGIAINQLAQHWEDLTALFKDNSIKTFTDEMDKLVERTEAEGKAADSAARSIAKMFTPPAEKESGSRVQKILTQQAGENFSENLVLDVFQDQAKSSPSYQQTSRQQQALEAEQKRLQWMVNTGQTPEGAHVGGADLQQARHRLVQVQEELKKAAESREAQRNKLMDQAEKRARQMVADATGGDQGAQAELAEFAEKQGQGRMAQAIRDANAGAVEAERAQKEAEQEQARHVKEAVVPHLQAGIRARIGQAADPLLKGIKGAREAQQERQEEQADYDALTPFGKAVYDQARQMYGADHIDAMLQAKEAEEEAKQDTKQQTKGQHQAVQEGQRLGSHGGLYGRIGLALMQGADPKSLAAEAGATMAGAGLVGRGQADSAGRAAVDAAQRTMNQRLLQNGGNQAELLAELVQEIQKQNQELDRINQKVNAASRSLQQMRHSAMSRGRR